MFAADFNERLGIVTCERGCSASRPKHNPPCRVAVDGLIDGEVDEPSASVGEDVEKCGDNCGSSKVR